MSRNVQVVRVFTRGDSGGNHLGVVVDASGLAGEGMQRIARELGYSESVFVESWAGGVPQARIFTPGAELPFAGHPLVGLAWSLDRAGLPAGVIRCGIGDVAAGVSETGAWIEPPFDQPVEPGTLDAGGWADPLESWDVLMPVRYHLLRLPSPESIASLQVPGPPISEVLAWAWSTEPSLVTARFFAPGMGVPEDPATGSAAVALATVLRHTGRPSGRLHIRQGDRMGSPSTIELSWTESHVRVAGRVVFDHVRPL